jgi:hypothetical protein
MDGILFQGLEEASYDNPILTLIKDYLGSLWPYISTFILISPHSLNLPYSWSLPCFYKWSGDWRIAGPFIKYWFTDSCKIGIIQLVSVLVVRISRCLERNKWFPKIQGTYLGRISSEEVRCIFCFFSSGSNVKNLFTCSGYRRIKDQSFQHITCYYFHRDQHLLFPCFHGASYAEPWYVCVYIYILNFESKQWQIITWTR